MKQQLRFTLKTIIAILFIYLIANSHVFAQLTGSYTIDNSLAASAANYKSFTAAVSDLNGGTRTDGGTAHGPGASGNVTFTVKAGETFSESPVIITYTNTSHYSIIFESSGTFGINNPVLQGTNGVGDSDAVIKLLGGSYYTFNGISFTDNPGNSTANTQMEYGIYLSGLSATGCQHNTFDNGTVTLNKTNTNLPIGIYTNSNAKGAAAANSNNTFTNMLVQNVITGYSLTGNSGFGGSPDNGNIINNSDGGRSEITNVGPGSANNGSIAEGIYYTAQSALTISNTSINNLTYFNTSAANAGNIYGIFSDGSGFSLATGTVTITDDTIESLSAKNSAAPATIDGIYLGAVTTTTNVTNCVLTNFRDSVAGGNIYAIDLEATTVSAGALTISGNTFNNFKNGGGYVYGFNDGPIGSTSYIISMFNNRFSNFTTNTSLVNTVYGVQLSSNALSFYNNSLSSFTGGMNDPTYGTNGVYGLYLVAIPGSLIQFHDDTLTNFAASGSVEGLLDEVSTQSSLSVYNCVCSNFSTTGSGNFLGGLGFFSNTPDTIYNNYFYTFLNSGASGSINALALGEAPALGTSSIIYNNMVYDLQANNSTASGPGGSVVGIELGDIGETDGGIIKLYFNTVFLNGATTVAGHNSSALFIATNSTYPSPPNVYDIRNNILVNDDNVSYANDRAVAFWYNYIDTNYQAISTTSNNNLLYAGTPSAKNLIFYCHSSDSIQTLAAYKTRLGGGKESASVTENPPFKSVVYPINVHINNTIYTRAESGGQIITSPAIITDIDGDIRAGSNGYTGCGTKPDIGADEFCGIPDTANDIAGPVFVKPGKQGAIFSAVIPDAIGYNWSLPGGATITAGANTDSITVDFSDTMSLKNDTIKLYATNCCGNGVAGYLVISITTSTGVAGVTANSAVSVYPNPNNGQLTVNLNGNGYIAMAIFDELGKEVYSQPLTAAQQNTTMMVSLGTVSNGLYFMQLQTTNGTIVKKIEVQR